MNVEERLARCFQTVFPSMPESEIPASSRKTVKDWDSWASVTLVTEVENEFGVSLDAVVADMDSFSAIAAHLQSQVQA